MASQKPVIHGRDHLPGGADPIPVTTVDPPWITVGDATGGGDSFTSGSGNYSYSSGGDISTNDSGAYYTFGNIPAEGTNGLTVNVAGVYEALISAQYVGTAGMTQAGVEASIFQLGYVWNGSISLKQIRNDNTQKGFWNSAAAGASRPRWHSSYYRLLLPVDPADLAASDAWLTLSWIRTVAPDGTANGTPFMYVRRISDVVSWTGFSFGI